MKPPLIHTDTALLALGQRWRRGGRAMLTVVVKATLELVPDGDTVLAAETDPPTGDMPLDADDQAAVVELSRSVAYPSDIALFKPRCDVVLHGHAYPPKRGATTSVVRIELRRQRRALFRRQLAVIGPRRWDAGVPSKPGPLEPLPLRYEDALGGAADPTNPVGVAPSSERLPFFEDVDNLMRNKRHRGKAVGVSAIPVGWPQRWSHVGSYDLRWRETQFPYFPDDFDGRFFQAAPPEQQLEALHGDEDYILEGVHAEQPILQGRLRTPQPRCFARRAVNDAPSEVKLRLDTLVFLPDEMKVQVLWRAALEDEDGIQELLLCCDDPQAEPLTLEATRLRWRALDVPLEPQPKPPSPTRPSNDLLVRDAGDQEVSLTSNSVDPDPLPPLSDAKRRAKADAGRARLEGMLARNEDLTGVDLAGAALAGMDLRGVKLQGAQLGKADLSDAQLDGAVLDEADLTGARLSRASLVGASLNRTDMSEARGDQAVFTKATGSHCCFAHGDWSHARFHEAQLGDADFVGSSLDDASFDDAALPAIRLYDAHGERVSFARANLSEARADGVVLDKAAFEGVHAPNSVWDRASLLAANFNAAKLQAASLSDANCAQASFRAADLSDARLARTVLRAALLPDCNLFQALLEESDLSAADLRGANLYGAETWNANVENARLENANLTNTKIGQAAAKP